MAKKKKQAKKKVKTKVSQDKKRNKYGTLLTAKAAKIDAALSTKPRTMAQLVKAAGVTGTFPNHLRVLAERGFVVKGKDGYKLKKR